MPSVPPAFLGQLFIRKACAFAGYSFLIYDYLLTISLEVAYIWNAPWTLVKALFLINRYGNLIGQAFITLEETGYLSHGSQQFCVAFQFFFSSFASISGESIRFLVVMRACAILRCRRGIAIFLNTLYVLSVTVIISIMLIDRVSKSPDALVFEYLDETGECFTPIAPNSWKLWFLPLSLDAFVFLVICHSLWRLTKGCRGVYPLRLIQLLARDAFMFYIGALFSILFGIVCWTIFAKDPRGYLQELIACPLISIIGQRLVLNLRQFQVRLDSTSSLGREVDRQIAAMDELSYRQSGRVRGGPVQWDGLDVDPESGGAGSMELNGLATSGTRLPSEGAEQVDETQLLKT